MGAVPQLRTLTLREGRFPKGPGEAVLDVASADRDHLHVGQEVRVGGSWEVRTFRLVGLVGYGTADTLAGATIVGVTLPTAQAVLGQPGRVYEVLASARAG